MERSGERSALISGVTGQDGSFLTELLLRKGYIVHGLTRRQSLPNTHNLDHLLTNPEYKSRFRLHYADLTDAFSLYRALEESEPAEIYNLAAQSNVQISFQLPTQTHDTNSLGFLKLLEAVRSIGMSPRIYQAGSSEMFGKVQESPQRETTRFYPRSPYAISKVHSFWTAINYRESYGMFVSNGILFNHESPRRGTNFVTRKVAKAAARIKYARQEKLYLGNLEACRDWGYAPEYVDAIWRMLQHDKADDFIVATGETHSVKELVEVAFAHLDLDWRDHVECDSSLLRPAEVDLLLGNPAKAKRELGWEAKVRFKELVGILVDAEVRALGVGEGRRAG